MSPIRPSPASLARLRKHSDYQRVYRSGRKQSAREISFFFALRDPATTSDPAPLTNQASAPSLPTAARPPKARHLPAPPPARV